MPRETALLAREMAKLVDRLVLYCYVADPSREGETRIDGLPVRAFYQPAWRRNKDPIQAPARMHQVLEANEDQISVLILIGSFIPENVPVARAARAADIPYVVSVGDAFNPFLLSGFKGLRKRFYERAFERRMLEGALAIRLYSEAQAPHLAARGYADEGRFFVAKEGIDRDTIEQEDVAPPVRSDRPPDPISFGFLGRLNIYTKGLDLLLEAWSLYKQGGGRGRLVIAGPSERRDGARLNLLRHRLDPPDLQILPAMYGQEKYDFLRSLSYLVLPTRHEGIPRVLREALAVGCPVIVTENSNLHDVVERYGAGAVVDTDAQDLARAFATLEDSYGDWLTRREGATRAAAALEWDDVARDFIDALADRLASPPGPVH